MFIIAEMLDTNLFLKSYLFISPHWRVGFLFLGCHLLASSPPHLRLRASSPLLLLHAIQQHHSHNTTSTHTNTHTHNNNTYTHHIAWHHTAWHRAAWHHAGWHHAARHHTAWHHTAWHHTAWHHTAWHHTAWRRLCRCVLRGRCGTCGASSGSDVRFGAFWAPPLCRCFCVAGVGLGALARGLMYALARFGLRRFAAAFAWQAWDLERLHGVWCTLWRVLVSAALPLLLRGRRGTWSTCTGSDVRFGAFWSPPLCRCFCVAGVGLAAPARGLMYALARFGLRRSAAAFAWQAWHLERLHGVWCTLWRVLVSAALPLLCVAGVGLAALARGLMYALARFGLRRSAAAFAWLAWHLEHLHGVWCTLWRVLVSAALPLLWRGTCCTCTGSDVRFGAFWSPPLCRCFCVAGVALGALARGLMYALARFGFRRSAAAFAWQAWDLEHLRGVWCTLWRVLVSAALPLLLRGRRGTCCTCTGSDVRFGAFWSPPLCRCFCVAGVALGALARGLMYALARFGLRRSAAAFAWQAWGLEHLHRVWCTLWRVLVSAALPLLLRGRCGAFCTCTGSDVRFGAFWSPPLCRCFCVAGGSDVRLARFGLRRSAAAFAWQAWDLEHLRGVWCTL